MASKEQGIELCKELYRTLSPLGLFPALTGGLLYKDGDRKDIDVVIYRHRQDLGPFETEQFEMALKVVGLTNFQYFGFVTKCEWRGLTVDIFNPETAGDSSYGEE